MAKSLLDLSRLSRLPRAEQCRNADSYTVNACSFPDFNTEVLNDLETCEPLEYSFAEWTATSIGNAAYMAQHSPNDTVRAKFDDVLNRYKAWCEDREVTDVRFYWLAAISLIVAVLLCMWV